ncbi:hypothetical protein JAK48_12155 [Stenotrophomonas maltophilia]|nr:hypothetical protein [Stenotrophomonas pavanii]MCU1047309.1 hypothetical protein [Stenotrophomonas maltophilia]
MLKPLHALPPRAHALALFVLLASSASAASSPPSPEEAYTLQARVYLQGDASAKASLEALGPGWVPSERIDWQPVIDDVPAWLGRQAFPAPSPAIGRAFAQALRTRLALIRCEATNFLPLGSPEIGMFALACTHPDVSPLREAYLALRNTKQPDVQAQSDELFSRWATLLRDAPDGTHCIPVTGWYLGNHEAADAARGQQLSRTVLMKLMPLDTWDAGEDEADSAELCEVN